ncbi:TraB/GumN family protein [Roseateles chitinivorans]|uniref:TraB/GumN family protein n=1 Tax=Roseateles chitinivorans TaxID=2917965 RepID=UPI00117E4E1D|nr:TraB/GumN family protein [Roseateles chitinivorans]
MNQRRLDEFASVHFELLQSRGVSNTLPPAQTSVADAAGQVENSARQVFMDRQVDPNPFMDMFVCPRNERWLPRLLQLDDGKTHFEAQGAAHLFSYEGITRRCDGLLQDLRRRGVAVTPVP